MDSDRFPNFNSAKAQARQSGASARGHRDHEAKNDNGEAGNTRDASGEPASLGIWDAGDDDYIIPPREWLLGHTFCKKFLSSLIADGGVGKTALRIAQIGSLATGRSLTGEHVFRRCRALILSFEDDRDELRRRVYAAMLKHGIKPDELKGWLFLAAPKGLKLAQMVDGSPQVGAWKKMLRDAITTLKLDIVCLDPFVKTHAMNENDNNAIDFVCGLLAEIGIDLDCAMDVPHHTNKGLAAAGDANKGRGATSAKDAARLVYTLTPMTPDEAEMFGLDEAERRFLVRYDSAKVNIAPAVHRGEMVPHRRHAAREFHRHLPGRRQRPDRRAMDPAGYLGRYSTIPCSTASSMTSTPACPTVSAIPTSALPENGPPGPSSRSTAPTRKKNSAALSSWPGSKAAPWSRRATTTRSTTRTASGSASTPSSGRHECRQ